MFGKLRSPTGGGSLLLMGIALLALAGVILFVPLPPSAGVTLALLAALSGIALGVTWWRKEQAAKYDLNRLFDTPPADRNGPEEPYEDTVEVDAAPYCGFCDEVYAAGTYRCERCGRSL